MIEFLFKKWLENQTLGGGLEPPMELGPEGQSIEGKPIAAVDYHLPGSDQLPPVKKKKKMKK